MKKTIRRGYVRVKRRLIVAEPSDDGAGYSWTLAAALGEMLLFAEDKFGPRDNTYTLLGIDFSPDGPQTWAPGDCRHEIIHLDMHCLTDRYDAYRISPTDKADANVLEEGLAVYFEQWYMHYVFGEGWWSGKMNNHRSKLRGIARFTAAGRSHHVRTGLAVASAGSGTPAPAPAP